MGSLKNMQLSAVKSIPKLIHQNKATFLIKDTKFFAGKGGPSKVCGLRDSDNV